MDQQRRLLTFTVLSFLILFGWMTVGPKWFPAFFPPPAKVVKKVIPPDEAAVVDKDKADEPEKKEPKVEGDKPEAVVEFKDRKSTRLNSSHG